ncbi:hypothetical protein [Paenibacillus sinopodophylli]|uniref:hypothetical protein n=1 Tax=Paenibacillus sinopodophylli TaxID=1837342 RepID=UPI00110CCBDF|nr:hypothetical protein [Paenibacillus sinopodophylli]
MEHKQSVEGQEIKVRNPNWGGARKGAGRQDGPKKQKRKRVLSLYLTDVEWAALEKVAAVEQKKLSTLINEHFETHARELIAKHDIGLSLQSENTNKNGE